MYIYIYIYVYVYRYLYIYIYTHTHVSHIRVIRICVIICIYIYIMITWIEKDLPRTLTVVCGGFCLMHGPKRVVFEHRSWGGGNGFALGFRDRSKSPQYVSWLHKPTWERASATSVGSWRLQTCGPPRRTASASPASGRRRGPPGVHVLLLAVPSVLLHMAV